MATEMRNRRSDRAARAAVFGPLLGDRWESLADPYAAARDRWRAALDALADARCCDVPEDRLRKAGGCRWFGVRDVRARWWSCDLRHACPFCWARAYVIRPVSAMSRALGRGTTLVEFSATRRLSLGASSLPCDEDALLVFAAAREIRDRAKRRSELSACGDVLASRVMHSLDPGDGHATFRRSGLVLVASGGAAAPPDPPPGSLVTLSTRVVASPRRDDLAAAAARAFRYPAGVLSCPPAMLGAVLDGFRRVRLASSYPQPRKNVLSSDEGAGDGA